MMRWLGLGLLVPLAACAVEPLRSEQLYESLATDAATVPDAGGAEAGSGDPDTGPLAAPDLAADVAPADTTAPDATAPDLSPPDRTPDADPDPNCDYSNLNGSISGSVWDDCNGAPLANAQIGIAGKHTCSWDGKGSYDIPGLPVGCDKTLTSARAGFKPFAIAVHVNRNGITRADIRLERVAPCNPSEPTPPAEKCVCTDATCVPRN
jgi:hypothetical protein